MTIDDDHGLQERTLDFERVFCLQKRSQLRARAGVSPGPPSERVQCSPLIEAKRNVRRKIGKRRSPAVTVTKPSRYFQNCVCEFWKRQRFWAINATIPPPNFRPNGAKSYGSAFNVVYPSRLVDSWTTVWNFSHVKARCGINLCCRLVKITPVIF